MFRRSPSRPPRLLAGCAILAAVRGDMEWHMGAKLPREFVDVVLWVRAFHEAQRRRQLWATQAAW